MALWNQVVIYDFKKLTEQTTTRECNHLVWMDFVGLWGFLATKDIQRYFSKTGWIFYTRWQFSLSKS